MELVWLITLIISIATLATSHPRHDTDDIKEISAVDDNFAIHAAPIDHEAKMLPIRVETGKRKKTTGDALRHLGMTRMKNPGNHHRKRLASQSRKTHSSDSHMYVIKLPHNPYYYDQDVNKGVHLSGDNVNRIPVSFKSNGKPGKIYHWNLPVVKKMVARKTSVKAKDGSQPFKPSIWDGEDNDPYHRVSYYKPKKPSKQTFQKYFPGNGKPQSLYVIETKKRASSSHRGKE